MRRLLLATILLVFFNAIYGQKTSGIIEINSYLRWDSYPSFTIPFNSVMNSTIKIKGNSWGILPAVKFPIKKSIFVKFGLGYYKYSFNNIQEYTRLFGTYNNRRINYPGGSSTFGYTTSGYWYNTFSASIGIEKLFYTKKNLIIVGGFDLFNYYTFSQQYIIFSEIKYSESGSRYFSFSANIHAGVQKKFGKLSIVPTLILPVYTNWKQDKVFPLENNNNSRSKWLRGIGVGITFSYSLRKA